MFSIIPYLCKKFRLFRHLCVDDGKPIRHFTGMQGQPYRNVIKRFGRRRGTEFKTIQGARRDYISIFKYISMVERQRH